MNSKNKDLFSAKCVFRCIGMSNDAGEYAYEERVILLKADDFDDAISKAEIDAKKYEKKSGFKYINFVNVYKLIDKHIMFDGVKEIYSLIRYEEDSEQDYLDFFYDTGKECTQHWKEKGKSEGSEEKAES